MSTTTRMLLVAPTGLGKTNFTMAIAFALAAGSDFMHWRAVRPARVLFVDGEMSRRLVRIRLADAARRLGEVPENLFVLCRDDLEGMPPLNTKEGQRFIDDIIKKIGGVDFIFFDNIQALTTGSQRDEEPWQQTHPWVRSLTKRSIGQCWVHHTVADGSRGYGDTSREWQMETVCLMEAIERADTDIAFNLKFTKARERAPHNRADFEPTIITLSKDEWASEAGNSGAQKGKKKQPSPNALAFHKGLIEALLKVGERRTESVNQPSVTMLQWLDECQKRGLIDAKDKPDSTRSLMSKYRRELVGLNFIMCAGDIVWNRTVSA